MPDLQSIFDFFNNQSVGAFLGAFAAYMLVAASDRRRERTKLKTLRAEIEANRGDARAKLETARRMRTLLRDQNRINPAPVLRFNTAFTRQITLEVLHHLSVAERQALEALCYTMEAIDNLISESVSLASNLQGQTDHSERRRSAERLLSNWSDTISNLNRLIEMCDLYLAGKSSELVGKQFDASKYEEA